MELRTKEALIEEAMKFMAQSVEFNLEEKEKAEVPEWCKKPLVNIKIVDDDVSIIGNTNVRLPWNLYFVNREFFNNNPEKVANLFKFSIVLCVSEPYNLRLTNIDNTGKLHDACKYMFQVVPIKCIRDNKPLIPTSYLKSYRVIPTGFNFSHSVGFTYNKVHIREMFMFGKSFNEGFKACSNSISYINSSNNEKWLSTIVSIRHEVNQILAEESGYSSGGYVA